MRWLLMYLRCFLCAFMGHTHWIYSGAGSFCSRCARDHRDYEAERRDG